MRIIKIGDIRIDLSDYPPPPRIRTKPPSKAITSTAQIRFGVDQNGDYKFLKCNEINDTKPKWGRLAKMLGMDKHAPPSHEMRMLAAHEYAARCADGASLYQAAGIETTPQQMYVQEDDGLARVWSVSDRATRLDAPDWSNREHVREFLEGHLVDVWMGNLDAVGSSGENTMFIDGKMNRIDTDGVYASTVPGESFANFDDGYTPEGSLGATQLLCSFAQNYDDPGLVDVAVDALRGIDDNQIRACIDASAAHPQAYEIVDKDAMVDHLIRRRDYLIDLTEFTRKHQSGLNDPERLASLCESRFDALSNFADTVRSDF